MSDSDPADTLAVLSITVSLRPPRAPGRAFQDAVVDVRVEANHRLEGLETELHVAGDGQDARGMGMADAVLDALRASMRRWADFAEVRWVAANRGRARASKDEVLKEREKSWQRYLEIRKALRAGVADQDALVSEAMGIAEQWGFEPPHDECLKPRPRGDGTVQEETPMTLKVFDRVKWTDDWPHSLIDPPPRINTILRFEADGMVALVGSHCGDMEQKWRTRSSLVRLEEALQRNHQAATRHRQGWEFGSKEYGRTVHLRRRGEHTATCGDPAEFIKLEFVGRIPEDQEFCEKCWFVSDDIKKGEHGSMKKMVKWDDVKDGSLVKNDVGDYLAKMDGRGICVHAFHERQVRPFMEKHSWPWEEDPECEEVTLIAELGDKLLDVEAVKAAIG